MCECLNGNGWLLAHFSWGGAIEEKRGCLCIEKRRLFLEEKKYEREE